MGARRGWIAFRGSGRCPLGHSRDLREAGGLGVLESPELGRLDDELVCGHLADTWNARQDVETLAQVRVCVAQRFEASIDRFDLAVDLAQPLSELTFDGGLTLSASGARDSPPPGVGPIGLAVWRGVKARLV